MNPQKLLLAVLACMIAVGVLSCKKDDEETTTYSSVFRTDPSFNLPNFVQANERYLLVPGEAKRASDDTCTRTPGIYWTISPLAPTKDTLRYEGEDPEENDASYILVIPDSLMTLTVQCSAFADGYYDNYYSTVCTVVDEDRSLSRQGLDPSRTFEDERDRIIYHYSVIDDLDWMSQNIRYKGTEDKEVGHSFFDSPIMDKILGRVYTLDEAGSACPPGWRLPVQEDFNKLARMFNPEASYSMTETMHNLGGHMMADAYFNEDKLWEYWPKVVIDNASGLSALPAGYASVDSEGKYTFKDFPTRCMWWTGDLLNKDQGLLKYFCADNPDVYCFAGHRDFLAAPVRCVREHKE